MGSLIKTPHSEVTATLEVLDKLKVSPADFGRIRADKKLAKKVAEIMRSGRKIDAIFFPYQELRKIMGIENCFLPDDWESIYGVKLTNKQRREIAEFPWSEVILNSPCPFIKDKLIKETHFAFLGIEQINGQPLNLFHFEKCLTLFQNQPCFAFTNWPDRIVNWYPSEELPKVTCDLRWYLILKEIIPGSIKKKTYEEQARMLPQIYEVPLAIEEVLKNILYWKKSDNYLNKSRKIHVRDKWECNDEDGHLEFNVDGYAVCDDQTLWFPQDEMKLSIGMTASRKMGF
ncbi:hypothetical protein IID20_00130 [Patescibacteria group bacterium]|nr:hypothetical protein [Patescibacteria group bacterium]